MSRPERLLLTEFGPQREVGRVQSHSMNVWATKPACGRDPATAHLRRSAAWWQERSPVRHDEMCCWTAWGYVGGLKRGVDALARSSPGDGTWTDRMGEGLGTGVSLPARRSLSAGRSTRSASPNRSRNLAERPRRGPRRGQSSADNSQRVVADGAILRGRG